MPKGLPPYIPTESPVVKSPNPTEPPKAQSVPAPLGGPNHEDIQMIRDMMGKVLEKMDELLKKVK